jgi:hypothetical protein
VAEVAEEVELWRRCWREGFAPQMTRAALAALADGLEKDDPRICQGATTEPRSLMCLADWPVQAADPIAYGGWQGDGLEKVGEVEEYFGRLCYGADQRLGEPAACRYLLNWIDDTPRERMRTLLLTEVQRSLGEGHDAQ